MESSLPFSVEDHPSAKSPVAREMLRRLKDDVQYFAKEARKNTNVFISLFRRCLGSLQKRFSSDKSCFEVSAMADPGMLMLDVGRCRKRGAITVRFDAFL